MKLVKKTAQYSIFQRGDKRFAVKDARKRAINGEEKLRILLAEELVTAARPATPASAVETSIAEPAMDAVAGESAE